MIRENNIAPEETQHKDQTPSVLPHGVPSILNAVEHALRAVEDTWNPLALHVSDLGYTIPHPDGLCPRQLWLRLKAAPARPFHRGELLMFHHGREIHEDLSARLTGALPVTAPGWRVAFVERSIRDRSGEDLGLAPDGDEVDAGTPDVEIHGPAGEVVIVDWKTVRGGAFRYMDVRAAATPRNALQVQTYARERDALGSLVVYIDREGQNFGREYWVSRDDQAVVTASKAARALANAPTEPAVLPASLERREIKNAQSLVLHEPWQCERCVYRGVSCPGALPAEVREHSGKVVAHLTDRGELKPKTDSPKVIATVEMLLWQRKEA